FFVHPAGGQVFCYITLARHLGPDQPFYGLQTAFSEGDSPLHTEIETMTAYYLQAIRAVQPDGPYLLGGWSLGGVVAFEMAQQLQAQGQTVALLALLDTRVPVLHEARGSDDDAALLSRFARDLGLAFDERQLPRDEPLSYILEEARTVGLWPPD